MQHQFKPRNPSIIYIIMWSCPGNTPNYYPGLRDILPDLITLISLLYWVSNCPGNMPNYYPGNMPNITVPNITTETYTKYNNQHYYKTQNWDTISSLYNALNENHKRWLSQYKKLEVNTYVRGVISEGEIVYDNRFSSWMCSCVMMMYMCSRVAMFVCCWHNRCGCKRL